MREPCDPVKQIVTGTRYSKRERGSVGTRAYDVGMTHPGDNYNNTCPRNLAEPVLTLNGRRSIVAWWPPTAVCEECSTPAEPSGGYVGPVEGNAVHYPDASIRFTCRRCARARVGLKEDELTGHICSWCDDDKVHVDRAYYAQGELESLSDPDRVAHVAAKYGYTERGWTVLRVEPRHGQPTIGGAPWSVYFRATRSLN